MKYGFLVFLLPVVMHAQNTGFVVDNDATAGRVQVINLAPDSRKVIASIQAGRQPSELLILPDNRFGLVTTYIDNNVTLLDLRENKPLATIATGEGPGSLTCSPDGRFVYVANDTSNDVTVIDVAARAAMATIPVGVTPVQVNISTNGRFAYAVNQDEGTVSVIDTNRNTVIKTLTVGTKPNQFAILPGLSNAYVVNTGSNDVTIVNLNANEVVGDPIRVGQAPVTVAFSSDSKKLYVVNRDSNGVSVIDIVQNKVTATIPVGTQPVAMVVTFDNQYGYVSNQGSNDVSVLDLGSEVRTNDSIIAVGTKPFSLMLDPNEEYLYVANLGPLGTVSVIDVNADKVVNTIQVGGTPVQFTMRNAPTLLEIEPNPAPAGSPITLSGESFVEGSVVRFAGRTGPVSVTPAFLDSQGVTATVPSLPGTSSAVVDVLHPDGNSSEQLTLRLGTAAPSIFAGGVVEGAGFAKAPEPISGGAFVSVFGSFPGMEDARAGAFPLPTLLGNTVVTFNGVPAPLFATVPAAGQINLVAPIRLLTRDRVRVAATVNGQTSAAETVNVAPVSPGIFFDPASGAGAFRHADYSDVTPANPVRKEAKEPPDTILLYMTGLGNTVPAWTDGEMPAQDVLTNTVAVPEVTVGGNKAVVQFSGLAPCCSGLYQINFDVPPSAPSGDAVDVTVTISGKISNIVKLAVQ